MGHSVQIRTCRYMYMYIVYVEIRSCVGVSEFTNNSILYNVHVHVCTYMYMIDPCVQLFSLSVRTCTLHCTFVYTMYYIVALVCMHVYECFSFQSGVL